MTEVIIIRHGQTDWNTEHRLQGWQDIELNAVGLEQAQAVAQRIAREHHTQIAPIDHIYSSDLKRAYQTAHAIGVALNMSVSVEPGLRERNFGVLEGVKFHEMFEVNPQAAAVWQRRDPSQPIPEGESLQTLHDRTTQTINQIAHQHWGKRVIVVTHGGTMDVLWRHATQTPLHTPRTAKLANASVNRIKVLPERWQLIDWGDVTHLEGMLDPGTGLFR